MIDYEADYCRIYELNRNLNAENVEELTLEDLQMLALMQKDRIESLLSERYALRSELKLLKKRGSTTNFADVPDFIAIDFETATCNRMACQLGIVVVRNYNITEELAYLIQPPGNQYDINCIKVHGIRPEDTESSPTFFELWPKIKDLFTNNTVVAHNAAFDVDVLKVNCSYYKLPCPEIISICTCNMHNRIGLLEACELYDIGIGEHHNALEDARACANLFIKYSKIHQVTTYAKQPTSNTKVEKNDFFFGDPARQLSHDAKIQDLSQVENPDNFFYNKRVVISGIFEYYPMREDLALILKKLGADVNTSISKKTDVVIFGNAYGPSKMKKVKELNESGCSIAILNEGELKERLS